MKCFVCNLIVTLFVVIAVVVGMNLESQESKAADESTGSSERSGSTKSDRESAGSRDPHAHPSNGEARTESLIEEGIEKGMKIDELQRRKRYGNHLPGHQPPEWEREEKLEGLLHKQTRDRALIEVIHPKADSCCEESSTELRNNAEVKAAMNKATSFQRAAAKKLGKPVEITNSIGMRLRLIPAGEFMMGNTKSLEELVEMFCLGDNYADNFGKYLSREFPKHRVRITTPYYIGATEVTQKQYETVTDGQPWNAKQWTKEGSDYPASCVNWQDAVHFCQRLSEKEERKYRLPTEAEWEYACRASTSAAYSFGDDPSKLKGYAWFWGNAWHAGEGYAHRVGQKRANGFGLCDMHGNVFEWCSDWYDADYYSNSSVKDPNGPTSGQFRVLRGGSFMSTAFTCRSAFRYGQLPVARKLGRGFRVVLIPEERRANVRRR